MERSTAAPDPILEQLRAALVAADRERLDVLVGELGATIAGADADTAEATAREALAVLRRHRRFTAMLRVAEASLKAGGDSPTVVRQYAQALIEEGLLGAALATLAPLRGRAGPENSEIDGLIGRAYKQRYVDNPASGAADDALRKAIDAYLNRYNAAPADSPWHGINAVALLARAERDGVAVGTETSWRAIADDVLATTSTDSGSTWDAAIAAEAYVALGDYRAAAGWLAHYASEVDDAFAIASTLRQLRQLWQIDEADPRQRALVDLLEARLLKASGGGLEVDATQRARQLDEDRPYLEAVFGRDEYKTIAWYRAGLEAAKGVVRIKLAFGKTVGTGFVLPGAQLRTAWAGTLVVVTNFHVVNRAGLQSAFVPADLRVAFDDGAVEIPIQDVLWESPAALVGSSPPGSVDTTVLRLAAGPPAPPSYQPAPDPGPTVGQRVYVIGHPLGQDLAFSLNDNKVVGVSDVLLHYRAPTRPGSSGSPVFDDQWRVVGVHHGGRRDMPRIGDPSSSYEANEGFLLGAVRSLLNAQLG